MRTFPLTVLKGGINRLRTVGSPSPDSVYDLVNGYVNAAGKAVSRPGSTATHNLPAGVTRGFCVFQGSFTVFSHAPQTVPSGVVCEVLTHPTLPALALAAIHFAAPFLRFLYVVAEFSNGDVFHYWLQRQSAWAASTIYRLGELVEPTPRNGYVYRALRLGDPNPLWKANADRVVGNRIEPTAADGFFYTVTATAGANPRSGVTEPKWNATKGAFTHEDVDTGTVTPPPTGATTPPSTPPPPVLDRYINPGGPRPGFEAER